jgi:monofunctional biosynthetic peptidoglycan transglycosylase
MMIMILSLLVSLAPENWFIVNDGVMGGVSSGRVERSSEGLIFTGRLSLENNGGFASVRTLVKDIESNASLVRLKVRGDGRSYQFRIRQDDRFDGIAWSALFDSSPDWSTIELPLSDFKPVFRGRSVPQAGPVVPERISQVGFLLADKNPGPFSLEVRSIEFLSD